MKMSKAKKLEKDILCDCVEQYINLANENNNTLSDYFCIISFINILKEQYAEYTEYFQQYLDLFEEKGILSEYKKDDIVYVTYKKYGVNPEIANKIKLGFTEGASSRYINFMIAIVICGRPSSKYSRKVLSEIYSWNYVCFTKQKIYYSELYLKKGIIKSENIIVDDINEKEVDIATTYINVAEAYKSINHEKARKNYETAITKAPNLAFTYIKYAEFLRRTNNIDEAISVLQQATKVNTYNTSNDFREIIDKNLSKFLKFSQGIGDHKFPGYDDHPHINEILGKKYEIIKNKYRRYFEKHRNFLELFDLYFNKAKNEDFKNPHFNEKVIKYIFEDLNLFPYLLAFYDELENKNIHTQKLFYGKQYRLFFKNRIDFCKTIDKIEEAIAICKYAIEYGFEDDGTKGGMEARILRLKNLMKN